MEPASKRHRNGSDMTASQPLHTSPGRQREADGGRERQREGGRERQRERARDREKDPEKTVRPS